ncbi:hypothetical protein G7Y79_00021g051030 [Physcia stellaris]|nr:hypothetical protein G7Y79_00021g051030 [Physcia stellaris]
MGIRDWNIDIDQWLNPYLPSNRLSKLPRPISHFLGHRNEPRPDVGNVLVACWAFVGAFVGVIIIESFLMIPVIHDHGGPIIIASFGAAAILEYNAITAPLSQPRNAVFGHFFSAVVGVGVTKLFMLHRNFEKLRWLAGAVSCGLASAVMTMTKTVYPPAGALALVAAVDPTLSRLGWYLLPLVLLSSISILLSSLLLNNIQRQYPQYWWTPADISKKMPGTDTEKTIDIEKDIGTEKTINVEKTIDNEKTADIMENSDANQAASGGASSIATENTRYEDAREPLISIHADSILVPESMFLSEEEAAVLETLRNRLRAPS